jgi:DNA-binding transcriptional LysR family regulator
LVYTGNTSLKQGGLGLDTKQIEYILKIAEENNITKAAEKLFLTQPALNQQLLRLEKELGTQLFHRSRTNWRPTQAGEIYLENARKMLLIKQETYRIIGDIVSDK